MSLGNPSAENPCAQVPNRPSSACCGWEIHSPVGFWEPVAAPHVLVHACRLLVAPYNTTSQRSPCGQEAINLGLLGSGTWRFQGQNVCVSSWALYLKLGLILCNKARARRGENMLLKKMTVLRPSLWGVSWRPSAAGLHRVFNMPKCIGNPCACVCADIVKECVYTELSFVSNLLVFVKEQIKRTRMYLHTHTCIQIQELEESFIEKMF